jgi:transcriptional regulator with XRE-family HTH domain
LPGPPPSCKIASDLTQEEDPVTTVDSAVELQAERIGIRIRQLRHAQESTLVQLAVSSDLSHPFLSQLERGRARPSMISLEKIARALGSSQLELTEEAEGRLLVQGRRRFHPMEFRGSNQVPGESYEHEGDEFLHVVAGVVVVDFEGRGSSLLRAGDSIYFAGGIRHRWHAAEPGGYRLFVVKEKPESR